MRMRILTRPEHLLVNLAAKSQTRKLRIKRTIFWLAMANGFAEIPFLLWKFLANRRLRQYSLAITNAMVSCTQTPPPIHLLKEQNLKRPFGCACGCNVTVCLPSTPRVEVSELFLGLLSGSRFDPRPQRLTLFHLILGGRSESLLRKPGFP